MNIISLAGIAVITVILAVAVRQQKPEYAVLISLGGGALILMLTLRELFPVFGQVGELFRITGMPDEFGEILLKSLGICFVTQIASDTCSDAGERAMAAKIEFAGRICVLVVSLPLFKSVIDIAVKLIGT